MRVQESAHLIPMIPELHMLVDSRPK